jgi:hypothetical protein
MVVPTATIGALLCASKDDEVVENGLRRTLSPALIAGQLADSIGQTLSTKLHEKEIIEAALAETGGRVSSPSGAAAKSNMPVSTLDSKIRTLKLNKDRFKTS